MKRLVMVILAASVNCFSCDVETLLDAIETVESCNGRYQIGSNGELGAYQIKKIVIDDVNRILGVNAYKYEDVVDRNKSRDICRFYIVYWSRVNGECSFESMARIWNGGPKGYKKQSTIKYWKKIKEQMKCLQ